MEQLKSYNISNLSEILLHVGINDIDNELPEDIAFKCEVYLSDITPRKDQYNQDVEKINYNLNSLLANSHIKRVKHSNIKSQHLYNDRHLKRSNLGCATVLQKHI